MKTVRIEGKRLVALGSFFALFALTASLAQATAKPLGWWDRKTYTYTIPVGCMYYHQFKHEGATYADAYITSSDGEAALTYWWNAPWLYVSIVNLDSFPVTVTWVEEFYVT